MNICVHACMYTYRNTFCLHASTTQTVVQACPKNTLHHTSIQYLHAIETEHLYREEYMYVSDTGPGQSMQFLQKPW